ncbi:MAG: WG repeat-containing protein, partial [Lachnospiraceae bacterium]|nr:WG repeat-containing protein [Lachnospiraceae bacterium]
KSCFFFIDKSGHRAGPSVDYWCDSFSEGLTKAYDDDGKCGFMDKSGKVVIPCVYDIFARGKSDRKKKKVKVETVIFEENKDEATPNE